MRRIAAAIVSLQSPSRRCCPGARRAPRIQRRPRRPRPPRPRPRPRAGRRARPGRAAGRRGAEPKITVPGAEGDYLRTLHQRIHFRFAHRFIEDVAAKLPATDPLNQPGLRAEIFFGVRWDGSVSDVVVNEKSGVDAFDQGGRRRGPGGRRSLPAAARRAVR